MTPKIWIRRFRAAAFGVLSCQSLQGWPRKFSSAQPHKHRIQNWIRKTPQERHGRNPVVENTLAIFGWLLHLYSWLTGRINMSCRRSLSDLTSRRRADSAPNTAEWEDPPCLVIGIGDDLVGVSSNGASTSASRFPLPPRPLPSLPPLDPPLPPPDPRPLPPPDPSCGSCLLSLSSFSLEGAGRPLATQ